MCEYCRQIPCHPRCPNAEEVIIGVCDICGDDILEGYTFYEMPDGTIVDEDCVESKFNDDPDNPNIICCECENELEYDEVYYRINKKNYCTECVTKKE